MTPLPHEIIETRGLLATAVVARQIAETIIEEEVVRDANISALTRVRRFLSRFFLFVLVALAIEGLVATFKALLDDPVQLAYVAQRTLLTISCLSKRERALSVPLISVVLKLAQTSNLGVSQLIGSGNAVPFEAIRVVRRNQRERRCALATR